MRFLLLIALAMAALVAGSTVTVLAHYNMLLPLSAAVKKGESVTLSYQWGHPFEHQLFDAPAPERLLVFAPDGKQTDLAGALQKEPAGPGKGVTKYRLRFTPEQRGDYTFVLTTPPIWMEEDREFLRDTVQVVLHVQAQKGWDADTGPRFKVVPLTRPYGLLPGMVFQAQALVPGRVVPAGNVGGNADHRPLGGALVEIERYNAQPPAQLPPDEFITRTVRTDPNGVATFTLTAPGWWCVTAQREGGERERDGKRYPVRERSTLWVFVDANAGAAPGK
jgi:cobalt/nickel transport protein